MKLAFLIFRYFPFGGQQRNMLNMALEAVTRGHQVTVMCHHWDGEIPEGIKVISVPVSGIGNHRRIARFSENAQQQLGEHPVDLVLGFIKLPELDAYYAADPCFAEKAYCQRGWLYRLSPRTRLYLAFEKAVFGAQSRTHILEVSPKERASYQRHYQTPNQRFHTLVPGISPTRRAPPNGVQLRAETRGRLGFSDSNCLLLALGSGFRTKGLERSIAALGCLHRQGRAHHLLVVGQDKAGAFIKQAAREGVSDFVHFLGGRDDVPALLQASDLLLHPAYRENTGNALLEAMIAGLPVIATATCGYAHYITEGDMGQVMADDSTPEQIAAAVESILAVSRSEWQQRGCEFADSADIYRRPQQAVDILESLVTGRD